jgi:uncharacterized membrane protein HdeD (DUF308 family)
VFAERAEVGVVVELDGQAVRACQVRAEVDVGPPREEVGREAAGVGRAERRRHGRARLGGEPDTRGKVFRALSGVLYLIGGVSCLLFPIQSTVSLTLFVGALLATEGVMELAAAATQKLPARGLVLLDGIVTAVLGGMLIAQWPSDSLWAIGTLFGISLAFSAVNLLTAPPSGGVPTATTA